MHRVPGGFHINSAESPFASPPLHMRRPPPHLVLWAKGFYPFACEACPRPAHRPSWLVGPDVFAQLMVEQAAAGDSVAEAADGGALA